MAKERFLSVYANPYTHVDHEGRPSGALPWDPTHNPDRGFVGATIKATITKAYPLGDARQDEQETWFEFSHEPQRLPMTAHYIKAIASGELIVADAATAALLGMTFEDPSAVMDRSKSRCLAKHKAQHGEAPDSIVNHKFGPCAKPSATTKPAETKGSV